MFHDGNWKWRREECFCVHYFLKQLWCNMIHKSSAFIFFPALLITHGFILEFFRFRTPDLCSRLFFLIRYSLSHFLQKILHYSLFFSYFKNNERFRNWHARYIYSSLFHQRGGNDRNLHSYARKIRNSSQWDFRVLQKNSTPQQNMNPSPIMNKCQLKEAGICSAITCLK